MGKAIVLTGNISLDKPRSDMEVDRFKGHLVSGINIPTTILSRTSQIPFEHCAHVKANIKLTHKRAKVAFGILECYKLKSRQVKVKVFTN